MNRNNLIAVAACALALSPLGEAAQTVTYTENFTGDQLADHIGTPKTTGRADQPVPPIKPPKKP